MDIFSGLDKLGFDNIEIDDLYAKNEEYHEDAAVANRPVIKEEDMLFDKSYVCPVCENKFKAKTVKTGRARLVGTDSVLRPMYEGIEPLKYDAILCNKCGYAALSRYFVTLAAPQKKLVKEKISANFKPMITDETDVYSFEDSIARYKLSLLNAVVKVSKDSEKAYICLKAGWMARSYAESLEEAGESSDKLAQARSMEDEFLKKAYEGYKSAIEHEKFPISGMDTYTLTILMATLGKKYGTVEECAKFLAEILTSRNCPERIKDKARDLKEELMKEVKK